MELTVGALTFRRVEFYQLTHQKQYVIQLIENIHDCYIAGRFLERVFDKHPQFVQTHEDGSGYFRPYGARFFVREMDGTRRGLLTFNERAIYYELVKKKKEIQQRMEDRALVLVLRKVIGDPSFTI